MPGRQLGGEHTGAATQDQPHWMGESVTVSARLQVCKKKFFAENHISLAKDIDRHVPSSVVPTCCYLRMRKLNEYTIIELHELNKRNPDHSQRVRLAVQHGASELRRPEMVPQRPSMRK